MHSKTGSPAWGWRMRTAWLFVAVKDVGEIVN
jgi:hypothetical protein